MLNLWLQLQHRKPIPEPKIVPVTELKSKETPKVKDLRVSRFDEFIKARSLSKNSTIAYKRDIQHFLDWCDTVWGEVSPRQVAQFKDYLGETVPKRENCTLRTERKSLNLCCTKLIAK